RGEATRLRRAGGRRICRVDRVDVERAVDGPAAEPFEAIDHRGDPALLHVLDADHLEAVGRVEVEVFGSVEGAADAHLYRPGPVDEAFFHGAAEGAAVVVGQPE